MKARRFGLLLALVCSGLAFLSWSHAASPATDSAPPPPPIPSIKSLKLEPAALVLQDGRDERRVLVLGVTDADKLIDLSGQATFHAASGEVVPGDNGYLRPAAQGKTTVTVKAAGREATLPVEVQDASLPAVRFVRDVAPVLSKAGCNQGTCHGSAKGKNGFKLSLRGYDPAYDYQALVNDLSGRRFNRVDVEESLMLLKPLAEVPHEGRQALKPGSREHQLLRQWIVEGTKLDDLSVGRAKSIEILPAEVEMDLPGRSQQLLVLASYADGSTREVTREAFFSASNTEVVDVRDGLVKGLRRGEAAILVRYEGLYGARLVTVMGDRSGYEWVKVPEYNFIDEHIYAKLRRMKTLPSELCTDAEFARRVYLDLTGLPPRPEKVHAFFEDKTASREKREKLVEELLASNDYVEFWANKWADLLQCNSENLGQKSVWLYRDWIRRQIARNTPYDQMVRALLTAQGSSYENPAVNYLRVLREPGKMTEDVSQTFLGVRFNCNKCHDHPFERWTQNQYYQMGAYFAQVGFKKGQVGRDVIFAEAGGSFQITSEEVVYRKPEGGEMKHPKTDMVVAPVVPIGQAKPVEPDSDRREVLVDWLTSPDNPFFAKAMANRIWSYFFGKGIIDPVDDIRASNPPSNPELLDALAKSFVASKWNLKQLMRTICQSRTYQLSIVRNKWNEDDTINFSHAAPRRLSAEQMLDALGVATGTKIQFNGVPKGMRAVQIPDGMVTGNDFLTLFGRPKRQSACECERTSNLTLSHALSLINGTTIGEALSSPDSRIAKLADTEKDDRKLIEEIYVACLSRPPTDKEVKAVEFKPGTNRLEVAQDLAWALLNSPAFLFNR
ncbi:MAG TPA: DUF1549 and DUF1553 domain-containing protein [Verrucomicrobiae bacterium]|nr:DUF1549 and DUF1553 domain-containing protein [Verrucomicrobiae bacterium]